MYSFLFLLRERDIGYNSGRPPSVKLRAPVLQIEFDGVVVRTTVYLIKFSLMRAMLFRKDHLRYFIVSVSEIQRDRAKLQDSK